MTAEGCEVFVFVLLLAVIFTDSVAERTSESEDDASSDDMLRFKSIINTAVTEQVVQGGRILGRGKPQKTVNIGRVSENPENAGGSNRIILIHGQISFAFVLSPLHSACTKYQLYLCRDSATHKPFTSIKKTSSSPQNDSESCSPQLVPGTCIHQNRDTTTPLHSFTSC